MTQIEKSGLFFILLGLSSIRDDGWLGLLSVFFLAIGLFMFHFPIEAHLTMRAPDFAICAAELHQKYDDEGDLYCRFCGKPLSR